MTKEPMSIDLYHVFIKLYEDFIAADLEAAKVVP